MKVNQFLARARASDRLINPLRRAGSGLWNVLGASRHDMTICSIVGASPDSGTPSAPVRAPTRRAWSTPG
ncbi:hypothetical protein [Streptomyces clavuligerus]|uniref:hypothetical protein n=1 Tax=Streptomyces clavuligerus TaxID=1901 RepID=UPI00017FFDDF|nr:hypothetical protein [Streptomyces clavuligerus]EDY50365.1 hypothetical protein SSCG_03512 [Streptomyces clavuligerus]